MSLQKFNNKILKFSNKILDYEPPSLPSDMDFIYQAKDFDGGNMKSYVQSSTVTLNNAVTDSTCVWRINNANKNQWCYIQYYVNRANKLIEIYCNGTKAITISNCVTNLINSGNLNTGIDSIFKIYSDSSSYGNLNIAELAVWNGKHIGVPTAPLG